MASIVIRTIIIYALLTIALRIMGKRQIGELDVGELVSTLLISELAAIPIDDPDIPLFNAIIPIFLIISIEIILSSIKNRSETLKKIIEGSPTYIIYKGRILQKELFENRISVNELLRELRSQGIGNVNDVEYGIIEQDGGLSIIKKNGGTLFHSIIIDGELKEDILTTLGYDKEWLNKLLSDLNIDQKDILLLCIDDSGKTSLIKKDGSF